VKFGNRFITIGGGNGESFQDLETMLRNNHHTSCTLNCITTCFLSDNLTDDSECSRVCGRIVVSVNSSIGNRKKLIDEDCFILKVDSVWSTS
jgi:hypothetical protein